MKRRSMNMWLPHLGLTQKDRLMILNYQGVSIPIIDAAQHILRNQFHVEGLQPVKLGATGSFTPVSGPSLQIHPDTDDKHFFVSCFRDGQVQIADSDRWRLTPSGSRQLQDLYQDVVPKDLLKNLNILNVEQQRPDSGNCGLYSVANVVEFLCTGDFPRRRFKQRKLRQHLIQCLDDGEFTPFPKRSRHNNQRKLIPAVDSSSVDTGKTSPIPESRKRKCPDDNGNNKRGKLDEAI
ncbi:uncharacterized protein LOC134987208 [Pseudophryne corroboree]|uniref:uncharacterized protein LOC134987208 n=1 Tax=Pseudophryne corroboree TaxID=495146 RepID=UPI0030817AF9